MFKFVLTETILIFDGDNLKLYKTEDDNEHCRLKIFSAGYWYTFGYKNKKDRDHDFNELVLGHTATLSTGYSKFA